MSDSDSGFPEKSDPDEPTAPQPPIILPAPGEQQPSVQPQQQPLILPAPGEQQSPVQPQQQPPLGRRIRPEDMVRRPQSSLPSNPIARIGHLWKNDPAYRVLFIAISVVLLSSLTCFAVFASMFNQPSSSHNTPGNGTNTQQAVNAGGTSTSSPTSAVTPTPTSVSTSTPTPAPTPTPVSVSLTSVQITSNLGTVKNNTTVPVNVTTDGGSGVTVHLSIVYKYDPPFPTGSTTTATDPQVTDTQGQATILWKVDAFSGGVPPGVTVTAQVTAIAQDQQGHAVQSTPVTVKVSNN